MQKIMIVDYGMANLRSVQKAFEKVGFAADISGDANRLAEADKLILKMYYLDGLSYRSIAGVMNVAPNTVSSYILRARDKLKKCIKEGTGGVS